MARVIAIAIFIVVLVVIGFTLYSDFTAPAHSPQYLTAQELLDLENRRANDQFWMHVKYTLLIVAALAVFGWLGLKWADKALDAFQIIKNQMRPENGQHALMFRTETAVDPYTRREYKVNVVLNPDNVIGHGLKWDARLGEYVPMTGNQPLEYHLTNEIAQARSVRTIGAMFPGDRAYVEGEVRTVPRLLGGAVNAMYKDRDADKDVPELAQLPPPPPPQLLTAMDAYNQSNRRKWVIGQNPETGALAHFDLIDDVNLFAIGVPGQGKSASMLMQAVAQSLKAGHKLIVLDGKGGSDFGMLDQHCEYHIADGESIFWQMQQVHAEYLRRQEILNKHRASNLRALRQDHGIELPHMVIVFDEFGSVLQDFYSNTTGKGSEGKIQTFKNFVGQTMRKGRAAGLHWVLGDTNATNLTHDMLTAMHTFVVAFRLDKRQNGLVDEQKAIHLRPGQFVLNGEQYNAFHFAPEMPQLLRTLQPQPFPKLLGLKEEPKAVEEKREEKRLQAPAENRRPVTIIDMPAQPAPMMAYAQETAAAQPAAQRHSQRPAHQLHPSRIRPSWRPSAVGQRIRSGGS